jgi:hypothetical protein
LYGVDKLFRSLQKFKSIFYYYRSNFAIISLLPEFKSAMKRFTKFFLEYPWLNEITIEEGDNPAMFGGTLVDSY